ncbi:hypothetical protein ACS3UN_06945 [Oscillospiraceae bacterium LTW-04]|nr:hypothetical protein RBH76_03415 [Oscillospiraceae bacterium MB24-C1]
MNPTITGDALKLLEQFVYYVTNPNTCKELTDAMYYDREAFYRRAKLLKSQLEKSGLC